MNQSAQVEWIEPYKGMKIADRVMTVTAQEQQRLLGFCGIDPAVFGGNMDPAGFITLAIREGVRNGIHANGTVNLAQNLRQHRPMRLGENLTVSGRILDVEEVPRGRVASSETWFSGADGERALTSSRRSLRPGPAMASARGIGEKSAPFVTALEALQAVNQFTLTPEAVAAYTGPTNPIHFDPEVAKRSGFRAPITGGTQCARFLTAEIWRRFKPKTLDLDIAFRRPLFWDDTFSVMVDERDGAWKTICLVKEGKVTSEARINQMTV